MNTKAFETEQFTTGHYLRLLKARPAIDNSPSKRNQIPYSSRNLTHMTRYEEDLKTKKLVNKLLEINDSHYDQSYFQRKKSSKKSRISTKNRKLTFSQNKPYQQREKTLVNPFKLRQKRFEVESFNLDFVLKLQSSKSNYKHAFSKGREKSLSNYSNILKKSRKEDEIRDEYFETYQKVKQATLTVKSSSRPDSDHKKRRKNLKSNITQTTRPQTAT